MKVIYGIGHLKLKRKSCVAVGVFDGVHRGHQLIIKKTVAVAKKKHRTSVLVTFYPHPDAVLNRKKYSPLLMSLNHRLGIIRSFGIDVCVVLRFDVRLSTYSARDFVADILVKRCHMRDMIINRTFALGKQKKGDRACLQALAKEMNFSIHCQPVLKDRGKIISSTLIRSLITCGNLERAAFLLGRDVEVIGTVVGGDQRGTTLGFPTANIDPHHEVVPTKGVYLVVTVIGKRRLCGLANIGLRPTFKKDQKEIIELHLLHFRKNIYGREIRVIFKKRLRDEIKFKNKSLLIGQIHNDIQKARSYFSS